MRIEDVPAEWKALGFGGGFCCEVELCSEVGDETPATEAEATAFAARLPAMLPFGTNSGWLALRMVEEREVPTVLLVRRDVAALVDLVLGDKEPPELRS